MMIENIIFILMKFLKKILKRIPKDDRKYVQKQLSFLDENFMDYIDYWNEKYYRNGFCDWDSRLWDVVTIMLHFKAQILHFKISKSLD